MLNIKCEFEGHKGYLNTDNHTVHFYNIMFKDMVAASKFLKNLCVGDFSEDCEPYYERGGIVMIHDTRLDWYYNGYSWHPFKKEAVQEIKSRRKTRRI